MGLYFFITYSVLVVTFYAAFLVDDYKMDSSFSGIVISLFFLAIMLPGLFINKVIDLLRCNVNFIALVSILLGLLCMGLFRSHVLLVAGSLLAGLGYGIMQPLIYDKTAIIAPPRSADPVSTQQLHARARRLVLQQVVIVPVMKSIPVGEGPRISSTGSGITIRTKFLPDGCSC